MLREKKKKHANKKETVQMKRKNTQTKMKSQIKNENPQIKKRKGGQQHVLPVSRASTGRTMLCFLFVYLQFNLRASIFGLSSFPFFISSS